MKQFALLMILSVGMMLGFTAPARAQFSGPLLSQYGKALDTLSNTTPKTQVAKINGYFAVTTIQVAITKISGTVAATVTLKGSLDGINYYTIGSPYTATDVASQVTTFSVNPSTALFYQISSVGTGTFAAQIKPQYLVRSPDKN